MDPTIRKAQTLIDQINNELRKRKLPEEELSYIMIPNRTVKILYWWKSMVRLKKSP